VTVKSKFAVPFLFIFVAIAIALTSGYIFESQQNSLTQTIKNTMLWVDSFDATRNEWAVNGSSPYLDAVDAPTNIVYGEINGLGSQWGDQIGDFGFEDHQASGTINSVKLRVRGKARSSAPNTCYFIVYLWDGSSWQNVMSFKGEGSYVWKEVDVTSILNTWDKINGAKIYLETISLGIDRGGQECDAALLIVDYS